jgi:hypothetical protein
MLLQYGYKLYYCIDSIFYSVLKHLLIQIQQIE